MNEEIAAKLAAIINEIEFLEKQRANSVVKIESLYRRIIDAKKKEAAELIGIERIPFSGEYGVAHGE